jgi:hypothetical protein
MADERAEAGSRSSGEPRRLFLPACLAVSAVAAAALACAFYFRGPAGDYNLYRFLDDPQEHLNEYAPADASGHLAFPGLGEFAVEWAAGVGVAWVWMARRVARREGRGLRDALARCAVTFAPLLALLLVPAHHWLGLPLTILPVFLLILCVGASAAIGAYLLASSSRGLPRPREGTPPNPSRGFPHPREGIPGGSGEDASSGYPPAGAEARGRGEGGAEARGRKEER